MGRGRPRKNGDQNDSQKIETTQVLARKDKLETMLKEGWSEIDINTITDKKLLDNLKINQDLVLLEKEL